LSGLAITGSTATFTTSDNSTQLTLKSTDDDSNAGPVFDMVRDSASPADSDVLGRIRFRADNDAGEETTMVYLQTYLHDASDGSEDGGLDLFARLAGTLTRRITINTSGEICFNEDSKDIDFRVESDGNANMLFVDAGNNRVGVGVSAPQSNMHVLGTLKVATGNDLGILGLGEANGTTVNAGIFRGAANNPTSGGNFLNIGGYDGIVFAASAAAIGSQTEAMRILSNQRVSIGGTSSNQLLNVTSSTTPALEFTRGSGNATIGIDNGNSIAVGGTAGDLVLRASGTTGVTKFTDSGGNITMTLTESNNVGIGSTSPTELLEVHGDTPVFKLRDTSAHSAGTGPSINFQGLDSGSSIRAFAEISGVSTSGSNEGELRFSTRQSGSVLERARILSNGTLLVGKTADDNTVGFKTNTTSTSMVASFHTPAFINRLSNTGGLLEFRQNSATKGKIGTDGTDIFIGSDDTNILFHTDGVLPANSVGGVRDNAFALGSSSARFVDLRLSGIMYSGTARIGTTVQQGTVTINNEAVNTCLTVHQTSTSVNYAPINVENEFVTGGSTGTMAFFKRADGTIVGSITSTITATSYATGSDQRLKENIADSADAGSKVDAIKVRQFDWKTDGSHQDYGMVAQELQSVAPEAVTGNADSDDMMMVDYSKLVPMLIKEIQSLRARVANLETEEAS